MAAKLEAEVRARERNTHSIVESLGEPKAHEEGPESRDSEDSASAEPFISALSNFFADLRFALCEEDPSKSVEFLKRAWKIAEESVASVKRECI